MYFRYLLKETLIVLYMEEVIDCDTVPVNNFLLTGTVRECYKEKEKLRFYIQMNTVYYLSDFLKDELPL